MTDEYDDLVFLSKEWLDEFKKKSPQMQEATIFLMAKAIADCLNKAKEVVSAKNAVEHPDSKNVP